MLKFRALRRSLAPGVKRRLPVERRTAPPADTLTLRESNKEGTDYLRYQYPVAAFSGAGARKVFKTVKDRSKTRTQEARIHGECTASDSHPFAARIPC